MSITPPDYTRWLAEPSIVIDPGLLSDLAPRYPSLGRRVARVAFTTLRTVACAGVVGVTLFSVAHADKWLARGHNSAHASEASRLTSVGAVSSSAPVVQALDADALPEAKPAAALGPQVIALAAVPAEAVPAEAVPAMNVAPTSEPAALEEQAQAEEADLAEDALRDGLRAGRRALAQNRLDDSEAAYGSVLSDRPRHPGALAGLARVAVARGDLETALKFAMQAVHCAPAHAVYHATLADVLRARGETAGADLEYEAAARLSRKPLDRAAKMLPQNPF